MLWEIVETRKSDGKERMIYIVSGKPIAKRVIMMRKNALSLRGKLDEYEVEMRRRLNDDSGRTD